MLFSIHVSSKCVEYQYEEEEKVRKHKTESGEISPIQKGGLSYIITKTN